MKKSNVSFITQICEIKSFMPNNSLENVRSININYKKQLIF
ncbi:Uncharacterised protein [uncultured Bacteroides sp.]|jgi:hypothetical protein|nr:Uncharacterised protein [uncultured Bacteroides sp.]